jgi:hypothetical protein
MDTAQEKVSRRAEVEATHNADREAIRQQYVNDKRALEDAYLRELQANRAAKENALLAAGLNTDGSDPQTRPVG